MTLINIRPQFIVCAESRDGKVTIKTVSAPSAVAAIDQVKERLRHTRFPFVNVWAVPVAANK